MFIPNYNHIAYFLITYIIGLTTGILIAYNGLLKHRQKMMEEAVERLEKVYESFHPKPVENYDVNEPN